MYNLLFPVDAWSKGHPNETFEALKSEELKPVMAWVLPLIVLIAGFSLGLGFFSSLFFYAAEAAILAVLAKFYLNLEGSQTLELFFNFWVSFLCIAFVFMFLFGLLSIFINF